MTTRTPPQSIELEAHAPPQQLTTQSAMWSSAMRGSGAQTLHPRRIASIHTGSVATQDGTLKIGDVIVTVNGDVTTEHGGYMITRSTK